jgi:hypothetical protein
MELEAGEESDRDVHLRQLGYTGAVITSDKRLASEPSVNFKEERYTNGELRNGGQKTRSERLKLQTENFKS